MSKTNLYDLDSPPQGKWSADFPIPAIGERVRVVMNGLGTGTVACYFLEHGVDVAYVGVGVKLDAPPKWRDEQLKRKGLASDVPALVFGSEIEQAPAPALQA